MFHVCRDVDLEGGLRGQGAVAVCFVSFLIKVHACVHWLFPQSPVLLSTSGK